MRNGSCSIHERGETLMQSETYHGYSVWSHAILQQEEAMLPERYAASGTITQRNKVVEASGVLGLFDTQQDAELAGLEWARAWIYLMSDCLIFAMLFATFGVLVNATAGGPTGNAPFGLPYVLGETLLLLISSFTFGMSMLGMQVRGQAQVIGWLAVTFVFGAGFVGMEVVEFAKLVSDGAGAACQCISLVIFHPGRHAWRARHLWSAVVCCGLR
jgi:hypothetical protein